MINLQRVGCEKQMNWKTSRSLQNFNVTYHCAGSEISMPRQAYANLQSLARPYKELEIFSFFRQVEGQVTSQSFGCVQWVSLQFSSRMNAPFVGLATFISVPR